MWLEREKQFIDSYPNLCLDKKDLILAQLEAYERLPEYVVDEDKNIVESEITEVIEIRTPRTKSGQFYHAKFYRNW